MKLVQIVRDVLETAGDDGFRSYVPLETYITYALDADDIHALLRGERYLVLKLGGEDIAGLSLAKEPREHRVVPEYHPGDDE